MATAYPTQYPNPQISGYAMSVDMGLSRVNFESGIARQRRRYTNMPHALQLSFVMTLDTLQSWQDWVNDNCYLDFVTIPAPTYLSPTLCAYTTMRFTSGLSIQPLAGEENYFVVTVTAEMIPAADAVGGGGDPNNGGVPFIPPFGPDLPDDESFDNTEMWPFPDDPVYPAFGRMGVYDPLVLGEDAIYAVDIYVDLVPLADDKQYLYAACDAMTGLSGANGKALRIIDVTNPLAMTDVSTLELVHAGNNVRAHAVFKQGTTLIIKFQTDSSAGLGRVGLMTVNVADPAAPAILDSAVFRTSVTPADKIGSGLMPIIAANEFLSSGTVSKNDLSINDWGTSTFPTASEVTIAGSNFQDRFARIGDTGYAAAGGLLYIIDLTSSPTLTFTTVTFNSIGAAAPGTGNFVFVNDDKLYAIDATQGTLEIWDVATPATPTFIAELQNTGLVGAHDIYQVAGWLFGLTPNTGFAVDVRTPATPAFLHTYPGFFKTTRLEGGWARWIFASELRGQGRILAQQYFEAGVPPIAIDLTNLTGLITQNITAHVGTIEAIFVSEDESNLYVASSFPSRISRFSMSTAGDFSTLTFVNFMDMTGYSAVSPKGIYMRPDGLQIFYVSNQEIVKIELVTPFVLTSLPTITQSFTTTTGPMIPAAVQPYGLGFSADGTKFFVQSNGAVYEWSMSTAWSLSTATGVSREVVVGGTFAGLFIAQDGSGLLTTNLAGTKIQFHATTPPYDSSTATFNNESNLSFTGEGAIQGYCVNKAHTRIYLNSTRTVLRSYSL